MTTLQPHRPGAFTLSGTVLVVGFARTGQAVAEALARRAVALVAIDDAPSSHALARAGALGIELVSAPDASTLQRLVTAASLVVVSPGVAPNHPVFALGRPEQFVSEIELAARLATRPIVAITGTNGKTTVTSLVAAMLSASGQRARAVGNIGDPLIGAIDDDLDTLVCEVSSFQLATTSAFRPRVGTWLNLAEDHLDWHRDLTEYAAAKARIWAAQEADDIAIANAEDATVMAALGAARARHVTFGRASGDYTIADGHFVSPAGADLGAVASLPRSFPHDQLNALAALATALESGAHSSGCAAALAEWKMLPHRVGLVATVGGVDYYDDSKATTPSAVIAALAGFTSVVLIAGGRNKGLDLGAIRRFVDDAPQLSLHAVVAIGEAADEVVTAFADGYQLARAATMEDAVALASDLAGPGDAVLLSPGCASFDWYRNYEERGEDFARAVRALAPRPAGSEGGRQ